MTDSNIALWKGNMLSNYIFLFKNTFLTFKKLEYVPFAVLRYEETLTNLNFFGQDDVWAFQAAKNTLKPRKKVRKPIIS